jgi:hypothetical protein
LAVFLLSSAQTDVKNPAAVNDTSQIINKKELVEGIWGRFIPEALKTGTLKPFPEPIIVGKGLEKLGEAIELGKKGVSAGKIVVEV